MKKIILFSLVAISLNPIAWAVQPLPKPEKCPSINAIQTGGFDSAGKDHGYYSVCKTSNYDTSNKWTFIIVNIKASSQNEAITKATATLATLSGNPKPTYINGHFGCHYNIGNSFTAQPIVCKS